MMSVFCSNTLSLLQSVRNTFLGAQISKLLSGGMPRDPLETCTFDTCKLHLWCKFFFFILCLLQSFCHLLKTLLTTKISKLLPEGMPPDPPSNLHFACKLREWCKFIFFLCLLQRFCHLLKTLLTTQISKLLPEGMPPDPPCNLHFRRLQVGRMVQVFFPSLPTPKLLPPT